MRRWWTAFTMTLMLTLLVSCVVSPKPEPPRATIDFDKITLDPPHFGVDRIIYGAPGTIEPAEGTVRATNLEDDSAPVARFVEADGSFELTVNIEGDSEIRLQVITDESRSDPLDVVFGLDDAAPVFAERPLDGCLILDPPLELDLEESQTIAVSNDCGEDVVIEEPRLRRTYPGVQVGADLDWPLTLADGETIDVHVEHEPDASEELIIFLEVSSPEHDRRPVTLVFPR